MSKRKVDLGVQKVVRVGKAVGIKLPRKWLVQHGLSMGDDLFSVVTIDQEIRIHLTPVEWSRKAKVRRAAQRGAAYITLSAPYVRDLGIEAGTRVRLTANVEHGILSVRREP